jgi:hypothetical protein
MPVYKKIQFIAWEIHTGPIRGNAGAYDYAGLRFPGVDRRVDVRGQCIDIEARIAFTKDAIEKAYQNSNPDAEVLKVFMAPEFLFRGAGGAYLNDLISGWKEAPNDFHLLPPFDKNWPGLFGGLQNYVQQERFSNWLFIFGTAVSASFNTYQAYDNKYYIDIYQRCTTFNTTLVQRGGEDLENIRDSHIVSKHMLSNIDFIDFYLGADVQSGDTVVPADEYSLMPKDVVDSPYLGSCTFQFDTVKKPDQSNLIFGLEICLDHKGYGIIINPVDGTLIRSPYGRLKNNNQYVDIQLVPSGGMSLNPDSICLLPHISDKLNSYAFNCDGLLTGLPYGYPNLGAHVAIWNQSDGDEIHESNKLYHSITDFNQKPPNAVKVTESIDLDIDQVGDVDASWLWRSSDESNFNDPAFPKGSGYVEVFPALELQQ